MRLQLLQRQTLQHMLADGNGRLVDQAPAGRLQHQVQTIQFLDRQFDVQADGPVFALVLLQDGRNV